MQCIIAQSNSAHRCNVFGTISQYMITLDGSGASGGSLVTTPNTDKAYHFVVIAWALDEHYKTMHMYPRQASVGVSQDVCLHAWSTIRNNIMHLNGLTNFPGTCVIGKCQVTLFGTVLPCLFSHARRHGFGRHVCSHPHIHGLGKRYAFSPR